MYLVNEYFVMALSTYYEYCSSVDHGQNCAYLIYLIFCNGS